MPHPDKERTGGEDAMFKLTRSFGVFDGVGGWADAGIDAGLYSRSLAEHTSAALERRIGKSAGPVDLVGALREGVHRVRHQGSCTACIVHIAEDGKFSALNVGDSGFRVLRANRHVDGMLALALQSASTQQQHYFNCPLQLGTGSRDLPEHGDRYSGALHPGDILLLATDGCFDNLFDNEITELLAPEHRAGLPAAHLATLLGRAARAASLQTTRRTPFSASAREHGYNFPGGKVDDVTVLCVRILDGEELPAPQMS
uniref:Protein phosphatase n=1 Tax=Calcidiscus leptoporus TaxID=127549 RepID=A0A7S0JJQ4_9EUKA